MSPFLRRASRVRYWLLSQVQPVKNSSTVCLLLFAFLAATADAEENSTGQRVFNKWCVHCHAAGPGNPGTQRLELDRGADQAVISQRDDLPFVYVQEVVRTGLKEMPSFRHTEISDKELDALGTFLNVIR
jgi:mono/diheme cytochrome c family protein